MRCVQHSEQGVVSVALIQANSHWRSLYNRPSPFNCLPCNFRSFCFEHSSKVSAKTCEQSKKDEIDAVRKKVAELNEYFSQYIDEYYEEVLPLEQPGVAKVKGNIFIHIITPKLYTKYESLWSGYDDEIPDDPDFMLPKSTDLILY
ncbi:unnamed protein product [Dracunculus medinensis]|uniref:EHD_N domain-containing protein n=1 Tax=Dracunculus medinensis TaxID=318479 RepID=A0A0N4URK7_DRAME|nr:unnamed protein product [Dracunculus medinensis]